MGDHPAGGAVAVGDQRIAVEHIDIVGFGEGEHLSGSGIVVEAGVGVDGQRQYIDTRFDELFVETVDLFVGREPASGLHLHFIRGLEAMRDEEVFARLPYKSLDLVEVEPIGVFVAGDDLPFTLKQAHVHLLGGCPVDATKEHPTPARGLPPRLRFAPTVSVPKLRKTSSCLSVTLLTFATARAIE